MVNAVQPVDPKVLAYLRSDPDFIRSVAEEMRRDPGLLKSVWDPVDYAAVDVPGLIRDTDGEAATNSAKYGVKWNWLPALGANGAQVVLDAAVGASGKPIAFVDRPGMQGGDVEFLGFLCKSTDRFACLPKSESLNLELANRPICSTLLFGRGVVGTPWAASFYEPGSGAVLFPSNNRVNALNTIELVGVGRRFIGEEAQQTIEARRAKFLTSRINPFFCGYDAPDDGQVEFTLFHGGTLDLEVTLESVGDFLCTGLLDDSTRPGGGIPNFKMTIQDGITGYKLMGQDTPVSIDLIAAMSLAAVDARLPAPSFDGSQSGIFTHVFARSSKILCHFESHDNQDITIRQAFRGVELRYKPAPNRNTNTSEAVRQAILNRSIPTTYNNFPMGGRS